MLTPLLVANWKMNKSKTDTVEFLRAFQGIQLPSDRDIAICPPFTALTVFQELATVAYGAQNMYWKDAGAFTGEISPVMLTELGCSYVILGHSERRQYFSETDDMVNKKVLAALAHKLMPIVCVGSHDEDLAAVIPTVTKQLTAALQGLDESQYQQVTVAYEPIWAIGTGKTATVEHAQAVHAALRQVVGANTRLLYGGSVTPVNASSLLAQPDVNGLLVGGASLEIETFSKIIQASQQ